MPVEQFTYTEPKGTFEVRKFLGALKDVFASSSPAALKALIKTIDTLTDDFPDQFVGLIAEVQTIAEDPAYAVWLCKDCGTNTSPRRGKHETYIVQGEVWQAAGMEDGFLCIGCLETRLGRMLTPTDFIDAPVNDPNDGQSTDRLLSRLTGA
jgi:hypothetical protein